MSAALCIMAHARVICDAQQPHKPHGRPVRLFCFSAHLTATMPLPKPPAKRAALLTAADFEAQAAPRTGQDNARRRAPPSRRRRPRSTARCGAELADAAPGARRAGAGAGRRGRPQRRQRRQRAGARRRKPRKPRGSGPAKLFVLDTNVLMHDPMSLFRFEEHDIYLPMITLEELDGHKKGMTEVARNARQVSRYLDELAASLDDARRRRHGDGMPLAEHRPPRSRRQAVLPDRRCSTSSCRPACRRARPTTRSSASCRRCASSSRSATWCWCPRTSTCASRRARSGLPAEDYFNDKTLEDADLLYTGVLRAAGRLLGAPRQDMESWQQGGHTYYRISGPAGAGAAGQPVRLPRGSRAPRRCTRSVTEITGKTAVLRTLRDYTHQKNTVWGVTARNREQNFALNLLMDPESDFVTLTGTAGTGKTLLTLAAGLSAGARRPPLHRDHHDPRDRAGRRGHRLPARHRGREDGPVDGRARGQPRGADARPTARPANGAAPRPTTWCAARSRSRA